MSYYRQHFTSFQEFQREGLSGASAHVSELGKDEYELLRLLEEDEDFDRRPRSRRRDWWE